MERYQKQISLYMVHLCVKIMTDNIITIKLEKIITNLIYYYSITEGIFFRTQSHLQFQMGYITAKTF